MKSLKMLISLLTVLAVLLANTLSASAIGFKAEEVYESVFVIYSGNALGSGFALGKDCIVTNAHVVENRNDVVVKTYSGEEYRAFVVGMDKDRDIAVLGVKGKTFKYIPVADKENVNTGDDIYAIGAPKSMAYTLTKGVISAKERQIGNYSYIQIDAAINEGNSGGPLLNDNGEVLGMNTLKMMDSEGIGLAIPMKDVCSYLSELGLTLDEKGNVSGEVASADLPSGDTSKKEEIVTGEEKEETGRETSPKSVNVAYILLAVSVIINIVLVILLVYQRKKNLKLKYDPKERVDFEIEILE